MLIYIAGADGENQYAKMLRDVGIKNRLESYHYLNNREPTKGFDNYLLDSGGFTARTKGEVIDVRTYAKYLNQHKVELAFELDTNDFKETQANRKFLEKNCPDTYIIPIFHHSDLSQDGYLKGLISDYPFIGLGGIAGMKRKKEDKYAFWAHVFQNTGTETRVHGLGLTTEESLLKFPFYSSDSTSWQSFGRYGSSKSVSKRLTKVRNKTRHYLDNIRIDMENYWINLEQKITETWEARGIKWTVFKP